MAALIKQNLQLPLAIVLCLVVTLAEANQATTYFQRPDSSGRPQLLVAIYCGNSGDAASPPALYHNQYLEVESKKWRSDRDQAATCTQDKQEILNYCKKVYPKHDIRNIVESSRQFKIDNWCRVGGANGASSKRRCRTKLYVRPYRCLEGTFQSDALLVPERCLFDHVHNKTVCDNSDFWSRTASENCHQKSMKLQSYAMLQPCGLDLFSGVEFVCCPSSSQSVGSGSASGSAAAAAADAASKRAPDSSSFAQPSTADWPKAPKYPDGSDDGQNLIKTDGESAKQHDEKDDDESDNANGDNDDDDDDEYDEDEDEFDDDSSSAEGSVDKSQQASSSSTSTTSTTTSTTTTTTTTTERPVDHYLSHFDLAHEHDEFRRAELAVEGAYREKIARVMKEWAQHEERYEQMKRQGQEEAAEKFKQEMTHQFEKTIKSLEEEGAAQRHQLATMHAERAMAIINRRKKAAMDCLTQALDRMPIKTRQVERCIAKLLRALEKDRAHTLRQYRNLLNINTREALREKKIILDHLVTLNRAANQSIAMLDRSPLLVERLKNKTIGLWHRLRNVPMSEPILRESELRTMEKYEEEVAQRKIEQERQRLVEQEAVQDPARESKQQQHSPAPPESSAPATATVTAQPEVRVDPVVEQADKKRQPETTPTTTSKPEQVKLSSDSRGGQQEEPMTSENEIHYQLDGAKFAHLKLDLAAHHELAAAPSYTSILHQEGWPSSLGGAAGRLMNIGHSALLMVSACTIVIVIALLGFRYYGRNSTRAYRRQGFAEVGRSCPEEKTVTNLQFNGYENPAYKFFEAEA